MMGIEGVRRRMRLAIGWVNSGLSMITTASGSAVTAALAVALMCRRIVGSRATMAPGPMTATSSSGNCDTKPWAIINGPPAPR